MKRKQSKGFALIGLVVALVFALGGCASSGGGEATEEQAPATKEATKKASTTAVPPPANSKLAKVKAGMSEKEVREAIGEPNSMRHYPTGKNWIPFYFGGDTMRSDWSYSKLGKVVLSNTSRWRREMKVLELRYDPNEP